MTDNSAKPAVSIWRKIAAAILDFFFVFFGGGYVIGLLTGGVTEKGFSLSGAPALLLFVLIIAYFVVLGRYFGGTVFQRLLGTR